MKVLVVSDLAIDAEFVADALDPNPATAPARDAPDVPGRAGPARAVRGAGQGLAQGSSPASSCSTSPQLDRGRLGPAQRLRPRGRRRSSSASAIVACPRTTAARSPRSSSRPRRARSRIRRPRPSSARSTTSTIRSSTATARSSTPCSRRCRSITTGRSRRPEGSRTLLTYADDAPALVERIVQGGQDRPRPALDDAPGAPRPTASRPRPGTSSRQVLAVPGDP